MLLRLRVELDGEAGEGVGWWCEAVSGARGGGFELRGGEDAQGADVAGGEMLLDSLLLCGWELAVDIGAELIGTEMIRIELFGG